MKPDRRASFFYFLFYLTANDGRPEPGMPAAGANCDNMMAKCQQTKTQGKID